MSTSSLKILCRYQYDPLDRLMGVGLLDHAHIQRFYQEDHLTTELGEQTQRTLIRHEVRPLAQRQNTSGVTEITLLATDQAHSLLQTLGDINLQQLAYTAYGHHPAESGLSHLLGFNGECPDAMTGHYLLGKGTRAFNPVLMRFNSPDELSPFGEGGINCYAYCEGDPINFNDPTGNMRIKALIPRKIVRILEGRIQKPRYAIEHTARSNFPTRNSSFNAMDTSATASAPQRGSSTSTLASEELLFPGTLSKTATYIPKSNLSPQAEHYKKLVEDGLKYDRYVANHPNFKPTTNRALLDRWERFNEQATLSERDAAKPFINKGKNGRRNTELEIKRYNIRRIDGNTPAQ